MLRALTITTLVATSTALTYTWNGPALNFNSAASWVGQGTPFGPTFPAQTTFGSTGPGTFSAQLAGTVDVGTMLTVMDRAMIVFSPNATIQFGNPMNNMRAPTGSSAMFITAQPGFFQPRSTMANAAAGTTAPFEYNCPLNWLSNGMAVSGIPTANDLVIIPSGGMWVSTFGAAAQASSIGPYTAMSSPSICTANPNSVAIGTSTLDFGGNCQMFSGMPTPSCGNLISSSLTASNGDTITLFTCPGGGASACELGNQAIQVGPTGTVTRPNVTIDDTGRINIAGSGDSVVIGPNGPVVVVSTASPTASPTFAPTISPTSSASASSGGAAGGSASIIIIIVVIVAAVVIIVVVAVVLKKKSSGRRADGERDNHGGASFENPLYDDTEHPASAGDSSYMDLPETVEDPVDSGTGYMDVPVDQDNFDTYDDTEVNDGTGYMDVNVDNEGDDNF